MADTTPNPLASTSAAPQPTPSPATANGNSSIPASGPVASGSAPTSAPAAPRPPGMTDDQRREVLKNLTPDKIAGIRKVCHFAFQPKSKTDPDRPFETGRLLGGLRRMTLGWLSTQICWRYTTSMPDLISESFPLVSRLRADCKGRKPEQMRSQRQKSLLAPQQPRQLLLLPVSLVERRCSSAN
jgi:hypothetical protein